MSDELDEIMLRWYECNTEEFAIKQTRLNTAKEIFHKINCIPGTDAIEFRKTVHYHNLIQEYLGKGYGNENTFG